MRYSVFGKFARNYERFYLARSSSLSKERKFINKAYKKDQPIDDAQTQKMKERIYREVFSGSTILKREIDRAMLYLNLPSAILEKYLFPTRLFPSDDAGSGERFPKLSKIMNYFQSKGDKDIPSLILIELEEEANEKKKRTVLAAFCPTSLSTKLLFDEREPERSMKKLARSARSGLQDLDDYDPLKSIMQSEQQDLKLSATGLYRKLQSQVADALDGQEKVLRPLVLSLTQNMRFEAISRNSAGSNRAQNRLQLPIHIRCHKGGKEKDD